MSTNVSYHKPYVGGFFPLTTLNKRQICLQDFISSWIQHRYNLSIVLCAHILTTNAADLYEALTANSK